MTATIAILIFAAIMFAFGWYIIDTTLNDYDDDRFDDVDKLARDDD